MQTTTLKCCTKCEQSKPISEFYRAGQNSDGYNNRCKTCIKKYEAEWRQTNSKSLKKKKAAYQRANRKILSEKQSSYRQANRKRIAKTESNRKKTFEGRASILFSNARLRASKKNVAFSIAKEEVLRLLLGGKCQRSGIPFDLRGKGNFSRNPFAPSIDRIDNTRGYEPGNIQLVCHLFNAGKGEARELDFLAMCVAVAKKHQNNPLVIVRLMELGA